MLHAHIIRFVDYCRLVDFSERSIQALTARTNEFQSFLKIRNIRSVKKISYLDLVAIVADFNNSPSIHVRKSRVWTLKQFYHFLTLNDKVTENIATRLPYPKIEKTVPRFLTPQEHNRPIRYFSTRTNDFWGLSESIGVASSFFTRHQDMSKMKTWPLSRSNTLIPKSN